MRSVRSFSGGSKGGRPPLLGSSFSGGSKGGRWARPALASALTLVALVGCANAEPGVAAYVDGIRITDQQVSGAVEGVSTTVAAGQQVSTAAVLNAMIYGAISERLAATNNIVINDAERATVLRGSAVEGLVNVPAARSVAYDLADQQIVSTKLGSEAFLAAVAEQDVTLNPRYGVLDPRQKLIVGDESGSLAKPVSPTPQIPQ